MIHGSWLIVKGEKMEMKKTYKGVEKKVVYKHRRGPLSKLMTEDEKEKAGIHDLSYDFGCRMTHLFQYLTDTDGTDDM